MKIEKLNKNQIRCTLYKNDLADRDLHLSELAYGTDKAKELFRDMMQQASFEFGFEAEDIPLMIEAIPVSTECLILIVTKVNDPDELDTRFSKFTSSNESDEYLDEYDDVEYDDDEDDVEIEVIDVIDENDDDSEKPELSGGAAGILDFLNNLNIPNPKGTDNGSEGDFIPLPETLFGNSINKKSAPSDNRSTSKESSEPKNKEQTTRVFSFDTLSEVSHLSEAMFVLHDVRNWLYKDTVHSTYFLLIEKSALSSNEFTTICQFISEYGKKESATYCTRTFFNEHYDLIIEDNALQVLASL